MVSSTPIGILGGTFDPIHYGHLRLAQEVLEQCSLSAIRFIPCGTPPHRSAPHAAAQHRLNMTRLALQGNPAFVLDEREIRRTDPCYTVDTLTALRAELGAQRPLCLLMGGDAFLSLHTWHEWEKLFGLAHIVAVQRGVCSSHDGRPLGNAINGANAALRDAYHARLAPSPRALHESPAGAIVVVDMPALEISATGIRRRCAEKKSIRYLLPDAVADYIRSNHFYTQPC
ncbi:MAG: nicotinate-nucleotide adenylyltransferase [Nitrosomonadales bacterium]|nr:nicotinate-nucleotide adenylyltransferase [Nitrosomonadales bacterium]